MLGETDLASQLCNAFWEESSCVLLSFGLQADVDFCLVKKARMSYLAAHIVIHEHILILMHTQRSSNIGLHKYAVK